jgi:hypothetical protein
LRDLLKRNHQFDEQDDVLWSRVWFWWELNFLLFHHNKKPCRTLPVTTGRGPATIPCRLRSKTCVACKIILLQIVSSGGQSAFHFALYGSARGPAVHTRDEADFINLGKNGKDYAASQQTVNRRR